MKIYEVLSAMGYTIVLAFLLYAFVKIISSIKLLEYQESSEPWMQLLTAFSAFFVTLSAFYLSPVANGEYLVRLTFSAFPFLVSRMMERSRSPSPVLTISVFVALLIDFIVSYFHPLRVSMLYSLLIVGLIIYGLYGFSRLLWELTDDEQSFKGVSIIVVCILCSVDMFCLIAGLGVFLIGVALCGLSGGGYVFIVLLGAAGILFLCAMQYLRYKSGRIFIFHEEREQNFLDAQRLHLGEIPYVDAYQRESYEQVFIRLREYFDKHQPFINAELSIIEVAKALGTNRLYLSRSINLYTGQNFRQFLNINRVEYSMRLFRQNKSLKVADLAAMSGFNTTHSYTIAFRTHVNMNPSEWCKKNREGG